MQRYFRVLLLAVSAVVTGITASYAATETRQLGAHEHGVGSLNIAVEGTTLEIELRASGADIVGFEKKPVTKQQKAMVNGAKAKLLDAEKLFGIPQGAACTAKEREVELEVEDNHTEFHGEYRFVCSNPSKLMRLRPSYFELFERARELDVQLIGAKGQKKLEITKDSAEIDLSGVK